MENTALIKFQNVSFSYFSPLSPVLCNISFKISKNEIICIVGPNGGGKTTLLKLITGLLKPDYGEITVFGKTPKEAGHKIGYMPQSVHYDNAFPISVLEVTLMGLLKSRDIKSFFGWYSKKDKIKAMEALSFAGMEKYANISFSELSGGQKQRVLIARAIVSDPEILILDEPTSNVDAETESQFISFLKELNEKKKKTIIMVSHDMGFVSDIVTSVFCINRSLAVHPTNELTGEDIQNIYSSSMRLVRHDHRCSIKGDI